MSPEANVSAKDSSQDEQISAFKAELMETVPEKCKIPMVCVSAQRLACEVATTVIETGGNQERAKEIFSENANSCKEGLELIDNTGSGCCVKRTCRHSFLPNDPIPHVIKDIAEELLASLYEPEKPNNP